MVRLFHYLSLLNIADAFITYYGLEKTIIKEVNPLMDRIYEFNPSLFILLKLSLSMCLYLFILLKVVPTSRLILSMAFVAAFIYTIVFVLHCWWLVLLY
jgi:hypothetical protein